MTTHTLNGREVLLVEVPEGAANIHLGQTMLGFDDNTFDGANWVDLPPGTYTLPSPTTVSGMSEEVAKGLVGACQACGGSGLVLDQEEYIDCCGYPTPYGSCCGNGVVKLKEFVNQCSECEAAGEIRHPHASLCSFIKSKSLDPDRVVVVIKEK